MPRRLWNCRFLILWAVLTALGSCGTVGSRTDLAEAIASGRGLQPRLLETPYFALSAFASGATGIARLTVYIEGDGAAFVSPTQPSRDPTPNDPVALRLAAADSSPVAYLARPCQFTPSPARRNCRVEYWTNARYAPEAIESMGVALDRLKALTQAERLALVGYSGGGTVAVLLAARRPDVDWVVTVAANLDHAEWTRLRGTSPLDRSLNAADAASAVGRLPQVHFTGAMDQIVPQAVTGAFIRRLPAGAPAFVVPVPGLGHTGEWAAHWPALLSQSQRLIAGAR